MSDKKIPLAYFFSWGKVSDDVLPYILQEFKENGAENMVFGNEWLTRILHEPLFFTRLRKHFYDVGLNLIAPHAPWGQCYDLCCIDKARRPKLIEDHKTAMAYAVETGSKTYTMHVGAFESVFYKTPNSELRKLALDSLEKLVPYAEKLGIVIAVENSYERSNSAEEAVYYASYFNSPWIGCCFDCGHANMMDPTGKVREKYFSEMDDAWGENIEYCADSLDRMLPYIVTCHLHDNNGYGDYHALPGTGTIDWKPLIAKIKSAPRLISMQTEVRTIPDGPSVKKLTTVFDRLMNGLDPQ